MDGLPERVGGIHEKKKWDLHGDQPAARAGRAVEALTTALEVGEGLGAGLRGVRWAVWWEAAAYCTDRWGMAP